MTEYQGKHRANADVRSDWSSWLSQQGTGRHIGASGITFTGKLADGSEVATTHDGREWIKISGKWEMR